MVSHVFSALVVLLLNVKAGVDGRAGGDDRPIIVGRRLLIQLQSPLDRHVGRSRRGEIR